MNKIMARAQTALNGESGGPSVEQVLGIAFALIIATAIFAFGSTLSTWIGDSGETIGGWAAGEGVYGA